LSQDAPSCVIIIWKQTVPFFIRNTFDATPNHSNFPALVHSDPMSIFSSVTHFLHVFLCAFFVVEHFFAVHLHFPLIWLLYCCGRSRPSPPSGPPLPSSLCVRVFSAPFGFPPIAFPLPHLCLCVCDCAWVLVGGLRYALFDFSLGKMRFHALVGCRVGPLRGGVGPGLGIWPGPPPHRPYVSMSLSPSVVVVVHFPELVIWCGCDSVAISLIAVSW